jgi:hypothetical protein
MYHTFQADSARHLKAIAINLVWFEGFFAAATPRDLITIANRARFGTGTKAVNKALKAITAEPVDKLIASETSTLRLIATDEDCGLIQRADEVSELEAAHWRHLIDALVEGSRKSRTRARKVFREWSASEEMRLFFSMFPVERATVDFYVNLLAPRRESLGPAPQSLIGFLRAAGGLRDEGGELKARDLGKTFPGMVSAKGLHLDHARKLAAEAGYLGANVDEAMAETTVNDLLEAIDNHPVYSIFDLDRVLARQERDTADRFEPEVEPAFEPGAEGLPQQLIPGVNPVSDRERIDVEAAKPMRGGNAAADFGIFAGGLPADLGKFFCADRGLH